MADGEINRNGATIRIDDDGGVQVEPAEGQEVEYTGPDRGTDAIRDSVNTEELDSDRIVENEGPIIKTWTEDGSSPDDRLSNAINNISNSKTRIELATETYDGDYTVSERVHINGAPDSQIDDLTSESTFCRFSGFRLQNTLTLDRLNYVFNLNLNGEIIVSGDRCVITNVTNNGEITFEEETENGSVGVIEGGITVTDNGNNEILGP